MIKTKLTLMALTALLGCALPGCGSSSGGIPASISSSVTWALAGLTPLDGGFEYEGWIIVDGMPVSTGRFNVDAMGTPTRTSASISAAEAAAATVFVLTIEPMVDPDPGPSETKVMAGNFGAGQAQLSVDHPAALGSDFTAATGAFILATPSSSVTTDDSQGIWWLDPAMGAQTLQLPPLPAGWIYEGWVVGPSGPVSTGRFGDPAAADSDLAGPAAGTDSNGPPFPGQDFVSPAMDLIGLTAVISVEPEPDDGPAPYALKPLLAPTITDDLAPILQVMMNNASNSNPTGTATID